MKKLILIFLTALAINCVAQSGASTAKLQSALNSTAVVIKSDLDSLQPYTIIKTHTITYSAITWSVANGVLGTGAQGTPLSTSFTLPSGKYELIDIEVLFEGLYYTTTSMYFFSCQPTASVNVAYAGVLADARCFIQSFVLNITRYGFGASNMPSVFTTASTQLLSAYRPLYSGTIYPMIIVNAVGAQASNQVVIRGVFRRVHL